MTREVHCPFGDGHIEADDDEQLLEKVRAHAADAHPELTDEQVQQVVAQGAHDSH
jgi:predicted small metal-binding protein